MAAAVAPAAPAILYTVPGGRTAIFRSLYVANVGVAASLPFLWVNGVALANIVWVGQVPAFTTLPLQDDLILNPGDVLRGQVGAGGLIQFSGFGSLLDGAPT